MDRPSKLEITLDWNHPNRKSGSRTENHILRIQLQAPDVTERRPVHIAIAIDTSASMRISGKLSNARTAAENVARELKPQDRLSLAGFADQVTSLIMFESPESLALGKMNALEATGVTRTDLALSWLRSTLTRPDFVRLAVLVTDGHPTDGFGDPLGSDALEQVQATARSMHCEGITLCSVGLGEQADFNVAFLNNLGEFLYAAQPMALSALLSGCLARAHAATIGEVVFTLEPCIPNLKVLDACQIEPTHHPLEVTTDSTISVLRPANLSSGSALLIRVSIPGEPDEFSPALGKRDVLRVHVSDKRGYPLVEQAAILNYVGSNREANVENEAVAKAEIKWKATTLNGALLASPSPVKTAEILDDMIKTARRGGDQALLESLQSQQSHLRKTGEIDLTIAAEITSALRQGDFGSGPVPRPRRERLRDPSRARLKTLDRKESFAVSSTPMVFGRGPIVDFDLTRFEHDEMPFASQRHAELCWTSDGLVVSDLGSRNGTYVNDERISGQATCYLSDGDTIRFGKVEFLAVEEPS